MQRISDPIDRFYRKCMSVVAAIAVTAASVAAGTPGWTPIALRTAAQLARGISPGGEGAQWPRGPIVASVTDPAFLLMPIDVGGLYRSLDGGKHWQACMVGWNARGANGFAIDPLDATHVLGVAGNALNWDSHWGPSPNGLYLSTNKASSWTQVLARTDGFGGAVAFDLLHAAAGRSTRAYYLNHAGDLFRSDDGGQTWSRAASNVVNTPDRDWTAGGTAPTMLIVASDGAVWVAGNEGVRRSNDGGTTFSTVHEGQTLGLCQATDRAIYVCGPAGIFVSRDDGQSFAAPAGRGLEGGTGATYNGIVASPADPKRLTCWAAHANNWPNFYWPRFVSHDGGENWQKSTVDAADCILPCNVRQGYAVWSQTDPNVVWEYGGDCVMSSTDGGKTFHWANNGYNGVMTGGLFNFNPAHPDVSLIGFQDYNAASTDDDGRSWTYYDASSKGWGGHEYGALALSREVMWAGDADDWTTPRRLRITRDGGKSWQFVKGDDGKPLTLARFDVSCADPRDAAVGFADDYRTADAGKTWHHMDECDGVFTAAGDTLYGAKGRTIVRSTDHGRSWQAVATADEDLHDLAVDPKADRIYASIGDRLKVWDGKAWTVIDTPADQYGAVRVSTVATDPVDPAVVYVGGPRNTYASAATICRSTDSGKTWTNLTATAPLADLPGGPHEVSAIRVNPKTRDAWVAGQCFGLWRLPDPAAGDAPGKPASEASAPRQAAVPTGD